MDMKLDPITRETMNFVEKLDKKLKTATIDWSVKRKRNGHDISVKLRG